MAYTCRVCRKLHEHKTSVDRCCSAKKLVDLKKHAAENAKEMQFKRGRWNLEEIRRKRDATMDQD